MNFHPTQPPTAPTPAAAIIPVEYLCNVHRFVIPNDDYRGHLDQECYFVYGLCSAAHLPPLHLMYFIRHGEWFYDSVWLLVYRTWRLTKTKTLRIMWLIVLGFEFFCARESTFRVKVCFETGAKVNWNVFQVLLIMSWLPGLIWAVNEQISASSFCYIVLLRWYFFYERKKGIDNWQSIEG